MREAKIVIPDNYNDGKPIDGAWRDQFEAALVDRFNGFTKHSASGAWAGPNGVQIEPVTIYIVACSSSRAVQAFAEQVKRDLDQQAVYIVRPSGDVQFI